MEKIKCDCCRKKSVLAVINGLDNKIICYDCLKYAPTHYGFLSGKQLINYIKSKKEKRWWQIWKN